MLKIFLSNNFVSPNQSGFKPGESCINQLLSITREIHNSSYDGLEVRAVFWIDDQSLFDPKSGKMVFLVTYSTFYLIF